MPNRGSKLAERALAGHEVVWVLSRLTAAQPQAARRHAVIATPDLDRHRIVGHVRELRVLVDYRSNVIKRRTVVINRLKAQLHVGSTPPQATCRTKALTALSARLGAGSLRIIFARHSPR